MSERRYRKRLDSYSHPSQFSAVYHTYREHGDHMDVNFHLGGCMTEHCQYIYAAAPNEVAEACRMLARILKAKRREWRK